MPGKRADTLTEQEVLDAIEQTRASFAKPTDNPAKAVLLKSKLVTGRGTGKTYSEQVRAYAEAKQAKAEKAALRVEAEARAKAEGTPRPKASQSLTTMEQRQRAADARARMPVRKLPSAQELSVHGFEIEVKAGIFRVTKSLANAMLAVEMAGFICSFNVFTDKYIIETAKGPVELSDQLVAMIRQQVLREFGFDTTKSHIRDAIEGMCLDRPFNPVTDWLDGLEWDGVPRLDSWLHRYLGAADTPLNAAIGRKVLCAMVERAKRPGCKFDHVMVLEGPENIGKSTVVRVLGSGPGEAYFSDATILDVKDKEQQELTKGVWAYEIGELTGIRKADVERVKQFISRQSDKARAAYAHYVVDQHRQCVFIGTTNDQEYLMSQTGNRRFWPVGLWHLTEPIDTDALRDARDQLFAEAVAVAPNEALFIGAELFSDLHEILEDRRVKHPWEDELAAIDNHIWVERYPAEGGIELRILTRTIFTEILGRPIGTATDADNKRLSQIMQRLGWTKSPKTIRVRHQGSAMGYTKLLPLIAGRSVKGVK
jgi:putative DNA primase/helicase